MKRFPNLNFPKFSVGRYFFENKISALWRDATLKEIANSLILSTQDVANCTLVNYSLGAV